MIARILCMFVLFMSSCGPLWGLDDVSDVIPRNLSWANIDTNGDGVFEDYVSSIKSQPCGDCYIYGVTGIIETQFKIDHGLGINVDVSEQNIHNCMKLECDRGGDPNYVLNFISRYGIQQELDSPTGNWGLCENCDGRDRQYINFRSWKPIYKNNTSYKDKKEIIISALQKGPVVIVIDSWFGFRRGSNSNTLYCAEKNSSGHVVSIVGYRNYGELMIVKNSHGGSDLLEMIFNDGDKCGFASDAYQIYDTYLDWNTGESYCYSTDDKDYDGVPDTHDNCPWDYNPWQENYDSDMFGNVCDPCPYKGQFGSYCL